MSWAAVLNPSSTSDCARLKNKAKRTPSPLVGARRCTGRDPIVHQPPVEKTDYVRDFTLGFLCGDNNVCRRDSLAWLTGNLASSYAVFGDVRDFVASAIEGRYADASIVAVGVIPLYGDALETAAKVGRFSQRIYARAGASGSDAGAATIETLVPFLRAVTRSTDEILTIARHTHGQLLDNLAAKGLDNDTIAWLIRSNGLDHLQRLSARGVAACRLAGPIQGRGARAARVGGGRKSHPTAR